MTVTALLRRLRANSPGGLAAELLRGGLGSGVLRMAEIVMGIAAAILLARQLGVAGLGFYSMVIAGVTLAALPIELGFPALVTREAARAHARGESSGVGAILRFASCMILAIGAFIGLGAVALWAVLGTAMSSEQAETVLAALAIPPLAALANVRAAVLRSLRKPLLGSVAECVIRPGSFLLMLGAATLLAPGWLSPARAAALNSASAGLALAFAAAALARHTPAHGGAAKLAIPYRAWLVSACSLGVLRGLRIAQPQVLLLVLGTFGSVDSAGLFRIAQRGAALGSFGFNTVAVLISPYLAQLDASGERARLQRLITASAWAITASALLPCLIFILAGRWLLVLLFGPGFEDAYPALVVLGLALVATGILGPVQIVLTMMHREGNAAVAVGGALVVSATLCALLAPSQGALGAAAAYATGLVGVSLVLWWRTSRVLGLHTSIFGL